MLKIKHIRLREKYGEGEVPHEAKTGGGPILLTCSFPYVRDWLNNHPFRNSAEARLICNLHNGSPIKPEAMNTMMKQLKRRIERLLKDGDITDAKERELLQYLLRTKKWNPYCIRHSAITYDSDSLPEFAGLYFSYKRDGKNDYVVIMIVTSHSFAPLRHNISVKF